MSSMVGVAALAIAGLASAQESGQSPPVITMVQEPAPPRPVIPVRRAPPVPPNLKTHEIPDVLLSQFHSGSTIEQYVAQVVAKLRIADRDGNGLDRVDVDFERQTAQASVRASAIGDILRYDLNADLKVTRAELEQVFPGKADYREQSIAHVIERNDANGDGAITIEEAADASMRDRHKDSSLEALLALDPNRDGRLMPAELQNIAQHAFKIVDQDSNGVISKDEDAAIAEQRNQGQRLRFRD